MKIQNLTFKFAALLFILPALTIAASSAHAAPKIVHVTAEKTLTTLCYRDLLVSKLEQTSQALDVGFKANRDGTGNPACEDALSKFYASSDFVGVDAQTLEVSIVQAQVTDQGVSQSSPNGLTCPQNTYLGYNSYECTLQITIPEAAIP